jgi:hypothetical protein
MRRGHLNRNAASLFRLLRAQAFGIDAGGKVAH